MKQNANEPRFGEKDFDTAFDRDGIEMTGPTRWGPKYADAKKTAFDMMQRFGLSETDFWIKKYWDYQTGEVVYQNLILSHSGCMIVGSKLPKEKQFDPMCVEEGNGVDGGCVLFYRSPSQGLFEVGEASLANNTFPFPYSIARNRLFDKVILRNAGAVAIYGEDESEDFKKHRCVLNQDAQVQQGPEPEFPSQDLVKKIEDLKWAVNFTGTNAQKMLASFGANSYEQLTETAVDEAIGILKPRVQSVRQKMLHQASEASAAPLQPQAMPQQAPSMHEGLSPVAQMMMSQPAAENAAVAPSPALQEEARQPAPLGETVYQSLDGAPDQFIEMNGQTLDQIGKEMLKPLFGRKNAFGRRYVSEEMLGKIVEYISA